MQCFLYLLNGPPAVPWGTTGWEQWEWRNNHVTLLQASTGFVPLFDPGTSFSSHFKLSLTKCLASLNRTFIVGKRGTPPYGFLEIILCIQVQQHKTTIPATFSQASLPFHSGTESDREQKAIRTVCSRTLFLFSFLDFEWLFLFIWNPINITFSFFLGLFFHFKALKSSSWCVCVCVYALQYPFSGGVF